MGYRIVPSIRQKQRLSSDALYCANDRWRDGGLEAHQGYCMMRCAVLPSSPYDQIALRPSRPTWLEGHLRIIETLLPKIALMFIETISVYHY